MALVNHSPAATACPGVRASRPANQGLASRYEELEPWRELLVPRYTSLVPRYELLAPRIEDSFRGTRTSHRGMRSSPRGTRSSHRGCPNSVWAVQGRGPPGPAGREG